MKTAKDFFDRLKSDKAFGEDVASGITAKREAGAANAYETIIPVASELGYEVTKEDIDQMTEGINDELSEEELGKVAGGTSCLSFVGSLSLSIIVSALSFSIYDEIARADED